MASKFVGCSRALASRRRRAHECTYEDDVTELLAGSLLQRSAVRSRFSRVFFLFHVELCASLSITPVSGEMFLYFCPPAASGWHGDALNGQGSAEMSFSRTREVVEKSYRR